MYSTLTIEKNQRIATIWMSRPEVFNAFDEQLIADLAAACQALDADTSVRAVILAGRGKHFSAGADLRWMQRAASFTQEQNVADARVFASMLRQLAEMRKPTLARVQGAALGGGMGLAAACDIAIAADDAYFATSEVKFGIIPSAISPYVLRAIGARQALRYFQSAERITAQQALAIGLVHDVVSAANLDETVARLCEALIAGGPEAQAAAKALIRDFSHRSIDAALSEETAQRIAHQRASPEAQEGIAAFLTKRQAAWLQ